ncbi:VOC family protein [Ensifer adhaerens]|uniref:VOC family protein n=1 Tax=Ensifer adhaerens TaxID=106592 RepID=UPI001CC12166|nr:VOC family protein [Ensifer adhaerens]MBZ7923941.1 VOC family protein [Ensifer adhaerens]UAX92476.1 VOC family protein [Ensifer adhaerens]UAY00111.1 VOC family protein [Ensifer adhaerens]UAY07494.1 VOC family protein [Ensifer adhaerens]
MAKANLIVLYVKDPLASVGFYRKVLGQEPRVTYQTFSSFELPGGFTLGLWAEHTVAPEPTSSGHRGELAFMVENEGAVRAHYEDWKEKGLPIAQELTEMDFGPTFVALDPDGHRLRVCLYDS